MPKLKLTYFDFDGGRGEAARLALVLGNVAFEDDRVTREQWPTRKAEQPFGALPVLYVDGVAVSQSNAINRYVGKLTDLYPSDPLQAATCDEVMDAVEDVTGSIGATIPMPDDEKKAKRLVLVAEKIPTFLSGLQKILTRNGGKYFVGNRLSVADFRVYDWVAHLQSGILDHVPKDIVEKHAPSLVKHCEMVKNEPKIKEYYAKRTHKEF